MKYDNPRNYLLFEIGIYTGLRISDILNLKVKDVKDRRKITVRAIKTGKQRNIAINKELLKDFKDYCETKADGEYLITSREGTNKPITRDMAYKIMRDIAEKFNLENIGTHSLRKTFGYHYYNKTKDIATLQSLYNHTHPSITLRYIGITQNMIDQATLDIQY